MLYSRSDPTSRPDSAAHDLGRRALDSSVGGGILIFLGAAGFQGKYGLLPPIAALVVTAALMFGSLALLTNADRAVAADPTLTKTGRSQAVRQRYVLITRLEYGGFFVALVACNLLGEMIWLLPIVAIISGLQFVAQGRLLRSVSAWVKGALLCMLALATLLLLPEFYPAHAAASAQIYLWWVVVGLAGGAILWFDAILCLVVGFRGRAPQGTTAG